MLLILLVHPFSCFSRELALEEGWRNVTMRKIAGKIEYGHAAIYEYFQDKDVLLLELLREGFRLLIQEVQAAKSKPSCSLSKHCKTHCRSGRPSRKHSGRQTLIAPSCGSAA